MDSNICNGINDDTTIFFMIDGKMKPVETSHKFFNEINTELTNHNWNKITELVNIETDVEKETTLLPIHKVIIKNGEIFFNGDLFNKCLTNRVVEIAKEGAVILDIHTN